VLVAAFLTVPLLAGSSASFVDPDSDGLGDFVYITDPVTGGLAAGNLQVAGCAGSGADPGADCIAGGGGCTVDCGENFGDDAQVVVAMVDTGGNPYHTEFRDEARLQHPSEYLSGFPATADGVPLCFIDEAVTDTFAYNDDCSATWGTARTGDSTAWGTIASNELVWFPGTRLMGISLAHDGQAGYNILDGTRDLADAGDTHGSWVSSTAVGQTAGTCPECLLVIIEVDSVAAIGQGYAWAAAQPWIDVITSSVSVGVIGLGINPGMYPEQNAGAQSAVQKGKLFFEAAGNGAANAGLVPTSTWVLGSSSPNTIAVGSANENTDEAASYYDVPVEVLGTGHARDAATPGTMGGFQSVGGTSFASPSAAGVAARGLLKARDAVGDTDEGATISGASLTMLRNANEVTISSGPFSNGVLTLDEFREVVLKNAEPAPTTPGGNHCLGCHVDTPVSFVWEGYGSLNAGHFGVLGGGTARDQEIADTLLGTRALPERPLPQMWREQVVDQVDEFTWGARPVMDGDGDLFPRNDYANCPDCAVPDESAALATDLLGASTYEQVAAILADHGIQSVAASPAGLPNPVQQGRTLSGTEADPEADDPTGDGTPPVPVPGADIGAVWISDDDGDSFEVHLRLNEEPTPAVITPVGAAVIAPAYGVDFTLVRTTVDYGLRGSVDPTGVWSFDLKATTADGANICSFGDLTGDFTDGVLTFVVDYEDLSLSVPPTATGVTCTLVQDDAAVGQDTLDGIVGLSSHVIGLVDFGGTFGDASSTPGTYVLGGDGDEEEILEVALSINGVSFGTAVPAGDGSWSFNVDFDALTPNVDNAFVIAATYGGATDAITLLTETVGSCGDGEEASGDGCAEVDIDNVLPMVVSLARVDGLATRLINNVDNQAEYTAVVQDDNGCPDIVSGIGVEVLFGETVYESLTGSDLVVSACDVDSYGVSFAVNFPAETTAGFYDVVLTVVDQPGASASETLVIEVRLPPMIALAYTHGLDYLQFPGVVPGATGVVSSNEFTFVHDFDTAQDLVFEIQDFTCDSCDVIPTVGHVTLMVDGVEMAYVAGQLDLPAVAANTPVTVQVILDDIPAVLLPGTYATTFSVTVATPAP
jgi:hypothetical protein